MNIRDNKEEQQVNAKERFAVDPLYDRHNVGGDLVIVEVGEVIENQHQPVAEPLVFLASTLKLYLLTGKLGAYVQTILR